MTVRRGLSSLLFSLTLSVLLSACVTTSTTSTAQPVTGGGERVDPDLDEAARINTELGMNYARAGNYEIALDKFRRALKQNKNYAPAHQGIAFIYVQRKDMVRAEEHYKRSIRIDSSDASTQSNYGIFLCGQGRFDEAEKHFLNAANNRDYRQRHTAFANAGVCARRIPDLDKAEAYFRSALELSPQFPEALQQLSGVYLERRDYAKARQYLRRYEEVGPPTPATLWIGAKIEFALGDEIAAARYAQRLREEFPNSQESISFTKASSS